MNVVTCTAVGTDGTETPTGHAQGVEMLPTEKYHPGGKHARNVAQRVRRGHGNAGADPVLLHNRRGAHADRGGRRGGVPRRAARRAGRRRGVHPQRLPEGRHPPGGGDRALQVHEGKGDADVQRPARRRRSVRRGEADHRRADPLLLQPGIRDERVPREPDVRPRNRKPQIFQGG